MSYERMRSLLWVVCQPFVFTMVTVLQYSILGYTCPSCYNGVHATRFNITHNNLSQDLASPEGARSVFRIFSFALKFGRRFGSCAAEPPAKFRSDISVLSYNVAALIIRQVVLFDTESRPLGIDSPTGDVSDEEGVVSLYSVSPSW